MAIDTSAALEVALEAKWLDVAREVVVVVFGETLPFP